MAASTVIGNLRILFSANTAEAKAGMDDLARSADRMTKSLQTTGRQASAIGSALTQTVTLPLVALSGASIKAAMDFESSFAGVRKTVNATEAEFAEMETAFRSLAKTIPVNVNELNRLGEAAGALGIPKAEIVDFARVMAELGVTTNLTSDAAAEGVAKIQNVFGAAGKETENFASALVALGNEGASTESEILEMSKRIAGAGHALNMSQADVLAFASALSSVGIEAEMGGSAISRVFIDIQSAVSEGGNELAQFAKVAKMAVGDFQDLFKRDAAQAVNAFIQGLGALKAEGGDLLKTLNELGFSEIRVRDTLLRAAGAGDILTKSLNTSAKAWRENSALTAEAQKRYETTSAQLQLLWNRIQDVGITIGNALLPGVRALVSLFDVLLPIVEGLAKGFGALPGPIQAVAIGFGAILAAAGPALYLFGQLAQSATAITIAFGKKGIATKLLAGSLASAGTAAAGAAGSVGLLGGALALLTNPVTWLIAGLGALAVVLYKVTTAQSALEQEASSNAIAFRDSTQALGAAIDTYKELAHNQSLTAEETKRLTDATALLAAASGLSVDAFQREIEKSGDLWSALEELRKKKEQLNRQNLEQAGAAARMAQENLARAQAELARVEAGAGKRVEIPQFFAPGIAPAQPREVGLSLEQRSRERARLVAEIATLQQKADAAAGTLAALTKTGDEWAGVALKGATATAAAGTATKTYAGQLQAAQAEIAKLARTDPAGFKDLTTAIKSGKFQLDELEKGSGLSALAFKVLTDQVKAGGKTFDKAAKDLQKLNDELSGGAAVQAAEELMKVLPPLANMSETQLKRVRDEIGAGIAATQRMGREAPAAWRDTFVEVTKAIDQYEKAAIGIEAVTELTEEYGDVHARELEKANRARAAHFAALDKLSKDAVDQLLEVEEDSLEKRLYLVHREYEEKRRAVESFGLDREIELAEINRQEQIAAANATKAWQKHVNDTRNEARKLPGYFERALSTIPGFIRAAFTGGREAVADFARGAASDLLGQFGANMFGKLAAKLSGGLAKLLGTTITSALGKVLPGIGEVLGQLVVPLFDKIFGNAGRRLIRDFVADTFGSFDNLRKELLQFGAAGDEIWRSLTQGSGRNNPEQAKQVIADFQKRLEELRARQAQFNTDLGGMLERVRELGGTIPESLRPYLDTLREAGRLTQDNIDLIAQLTGEGVVDWEQMQATAEKYGIAIDGLGDRFQAQRLHAGWQQIIDDMDLLERGGADMNAVLDGMQDEINELVQESIKFGTEIPENMRPWIEKLIVSGELLDENGEKITDINKLKFGETLQTSLQKLTDEIKKLIDALDKVPGKVNAIPKKVTTEVETRHTTVYEPPQGQPPPPEPEGWGTEPPPGYQRPPYPEPPFPGARFATGGIVPPPVYAAMGARITSTGAPAPLAMPSILAARPPAPLARGTDTVPAMLTPGELVLTVAQQKNLASTIAAGLAAAQLLAAAPALPMAPATPPAVIYETHHHHTWHAVDGESVRAFVQRREFADTFDEEARRNTNGIGTTIKRMSEGR